jgi:hypothetical protein
VAIDCSSTAKYNPISIGEMSIELPHSQEKGAGLPGEKVDPEWEELGSKIEKKIKRKLKQWAEEA